MQTKPLSQLAIISVLVVSAVGCSSFQDRGSEDQKSGGMFGLRSPRDHDPTMDETLDPMGARSINQLMMEDLAPDQFTTTWKTRTFSGRDETEARRLFELGQLEYEAALEQLNSDPDSEDHLDMFNDAANTFRLASSRWQESQLEEDALYYEGESYFYSNRFVLSNRAFEKLISLYSGSRFLDKAEARRMAIANYWLELARTDQKIRLNDSKRPRTNLAGEARRILHRIRIDDPTGKLADDATFALATAYFEDEQYFEAASTYEDLRRNYPGSPHQFHAHLFELKSQLKSYRGPSYDDEPLQKAHKLLKDIVQRFPERARDQEEFLTVEAGNIQNMLASRDIAMAEYFAKRGENGAAKIYYERIAQKYPGENLQIAVKEQIAKLAALPPKPEQRAKWLVDLFPNPDAQKPVILSGDNESIFR